MKAIFVTLVSLCVISGRVSADENKSPLGEEFIRTIDNTAEPIGFSPYEVSDLIDPTTGEAVDPWQPLIIDRGDDFIFTTPDEVLQNLNLVEQKLNELGISLKDKDPMFMVQSLMDPDYMLRMVRQKFEGELTKVMEEALPPLDDCPVITAKDFGENLETNRDWQAADRIMMKNGKSIKFASLIPELNEQQKLFCELGYSMLNGLMPGTPEYLSDLLDMRVSLMGRFGFDETHPMFQVSEWLEPGDLESIVEGIEDVQDLLEKPSLPKVYALAEKYEDLIPEEYQLPNIPTIPSPKLNKRTDLKLEKELKWKGVFEGKKDIAAIYADAWFELRAGRADEPDKAPVTDHAVQAEAKAGGWLLNNELNVAYAHLNSELSPSNGFADFKYCFLGHCELDENGVKDIGISVSEPNLYSKNERWYYTQPFAIGPIPCKINYGASLYVNLGYGAGLNLMMAEAKVLGRAKASGFVEGAVGLEGVAEGGLGGELFIIDDELSGGAEAKFSFVGGKPTVNAAIVADNNLQALNGRLYGYAQVDLIGAAIELVEKILETLENVPGLKNLVEDLGNAGRKLSDGAKKTLKKWGHEVQNAGKALSRAVGGCCKVKFSSPWGINISGTTVRYEEDIAKWKAFNENRRIMNYRLFVGPEGKEYGGDFNEYDSDEFAELMEKNLTYQQRLANIQGLEERYSGAVQSTCTQIDEAMSDELARDSRVISQKIEQMMDQVENRRLELAQDLISIVDRGS